MFLLQEEKSLIFFVSQMLNLENQKFLNGLDKRSALKVHKIQSSTIAVLFFIYICKGQEFVFSLF